MPGISLGRGNRTAYGPSRRHVNALCVILTGLLLLPVAAAQAAPAKLLAFGDSLTAGYGLAPEQGFTARLQAALAAKGIAATVVNGGVSGDTTADGLARLDWSLGDKPDYALVELGANDALRGLDPGKASANLDKILGRLQAAHVKILLCGMLAPNNWGPDYTKNFDEIYPALAKKYDVPLYPFFLEGVAMNPALNQPDMLHPNAAGVDILVAKILPSVEKLLGQGV
ncbi:MAG TPA: arylesterase [Aliidongia sp.]|nr:arylesterase [Aliidongia sp.]